MTLLRCLVHSRLFSEKNKWWIIRENNKKYVIIKKKINKRINYKLKPYKEKKDSSFGLFLLFLIPQYSFFIIELNFSKKIYLLYVILKNAKFLPIESLLSSFKSLGHNKKFKFEKKEQVI